MEGARHSNSEPHERTYVDMDTFMAMISLLFPSTLPAEIKFPISYQSVIDFATEELELLL